jgi:hypothetical protein
MRAVLPLATRQRLAFAAGPSSPAAPAGVLGKRPSRSGPLGAELLLLRLQPQLPVHPLYSRRKTTVRHRAQMPSSATPQPSIVRRLAQLMIIMIIFIGNMIIYWLCWFSRRKEAFSSSKIRSRQSPAPHTRHKPGSAPDRHRRDPQSHCTCASLVRENCYRRSNESSRHREEARPHTALPKAHLSSRIARPGCHLNHHEQRAQSTSLAPLFGQPNPHGLVRTIHISQSLCGGSPCC